MAVLRLGLRGDLSEPRDNAEDRDTQKHLHVGAGTYRPVEVFEEERCADTEDQPEYCAQQQVCLTRCSHRVGGTGGVDDSDVGRSRRRSDLRLILLRGQEPHIFLIEPQLDIQFIEAIFEPGEVGLICPNLVELALLVFDLPTQHHQVFPDGGP